MKSFFLILLSVAIVMAVAVRVRYGGGVPFDTDFAAPQLDESVLEEVLRYPEPIGNVAVNREGRVFFTVHPESRPIGNKLLEWVDGAAVPYPTGAVQPHLFDTILGLAIDRQNLLWTIDHGNHGFRSARLLAFDLATGETVHDHEFSKAIAPSGSFLQDIQVSADGRYVYIADASLWRKKPALIVYDTTVQNARRVLESHPAVSPKDYLIRTPDRDMSFLGGLLTLKAGVDGIALDTDNEWLYLAAMNHDELFRIRTSVITDDSLPARQIGNRVERYSDKPLSDGLSADIAGNIYVTDVEHGAIHLVNTEQQLSTLIRSDRIRWADALSFGSDGWLYLADSAIPDQVLQTREHIEQQGPYYVFRFQPGYAGNPGH